MRSHGKQRGWHIGCMVLWMCLFLAGACPAFLPPQAEAVQSPMRIVGYLPDWSYQNHTSIAYEKLTHLNIAFCNPDESGELHCWIPDETLQSIVHTAHENGTKVFAALGGFGGCDGFLPQLRTADLRTAFNQRILAYCQTFQLDGIDLDIELGASDPIWDVYGEWVSSLGTLLHANHLQLSTATAQWVAVRVSAETFDQFDFINVMAYDNDADAQSHASFAFAQSSLAYFHETRGIAADKLVLGVPFYGRGYQSDGTLDWGSSVSYADLVAQDAKNADADLANGIAYNGKTTIRAKAQLARAYGGIMIWEVTQDATGADALLSVIFQTLAPANVAGDINGDGQCTIADAVLLQKWLLQEQTPANPAAGDLDGNQILDAVDLSLLKHLLFSDKGGQAV